MSEKSKSKVLTTPEFKTKLASLFSYLVSRLGIKQSPQVKIINSESNANNPFGFTGHYDHETQLVTLYITNRHDTDILRSFAHEIIHHWQNERGTLKQSGNGANGHYAQEDEWLRRREMEAYLFGNILFRDWQDEQRYGSPKTPPQIPQPLDENLMLDNQRLKQQVEEFVRNLTSDGVFKSYHRKLTSGDMNTEDFSGDLSHKILSAVQQWTQTVNDRGNWENQSNMIK